MNQKNYIYRNKAFGISDQGLHLMRNGFNYKTIPFEEINSIRIGKGKSIKNWLSALIFGALTLFGAIFLFWNVFVNPERESVYILEIASIAILVFLGIYLVYSALKVEEVMEFYLLNGKEVFPTKELHESGNYEEVSTYLQEKKEVLIDA